MEPTKGSKSPYTYSVALAEHLYEQEEYFCKYTPRIHKDAHLADEGSWQCQVDFLNATGPAESERNKAHKSYAVGCINPVVGNFTALCACEALPERLASITYMVEYAYIHDDVIEYAEDKSASQLFETNRELVEGLDFEDKPTGAKQNTKRKQLQAKMAVDLMEIDREQGLEVLRLWKEMANIFVEIRNLDFKSLDDYLPFRFVDAGCPWTMSLLCFSMDFILTKKEEKDLAEVTLAGYNAWVLVNDYFSWEKEWINYEANGCNGEIVSAVFLFMKWHSVDAKEAKRLLRLEIMAREEEFASLKDEYLQRPRVTAREQRWCQLLEHVTAGNFAWSMTTARYDLNGQDAYPALRSKHLKKDSVVDLGGFGELIDLEKISASVDVDAIDDGSMPTTPESSQHSLSQGIEKLATGHVPDEEKRDSDEPSKDEPKISVSQYEHLVTEPQRYVGSMPSKGARNSAIDALDAWYKVPEQSLQTIKSIITTLHNSSLMQDDIQDGSPLRRGFPATHVVYGLPQTINSANLLMMKAMKLAQSISSEAASIMTARLLEAHIGQGMDLHWKHHTTIPTEEEYFAMVDGKTGGLFLLVSDLMRLEATVNKNIDVSDLLLLVARFFQARDDYQNLKDDKYNEQKGLAEDINEGKLSLPLIHALQSPDHRIRLLSILEQRKTQGSVPLEVRKLAVDEIEAAGGLEYTRKKVMELEGEINQLCTKYEDQMGRKNWILRMLRLRLHVE